LPPAGSLIHLMGVAGAGMRGLAVLLSCSGYRVSGCDSAPLAAADDLEGHTVGIASGHDPDHLQDVDLLVHSSAVPADQPELRAGREASIRTMKRARALGALLNSLRLVGIAGTHGKTTITAMTARVCEAAGLDPTVVVGGHVPEWSGYARPGSSEVAIAEADEYDRSLLELDPSLAVISSVEPEHLDSYGSMSALVEAFRTFASRAADRDGVLVCADDAGAVEIGRDVNTVFSYGFESAADFRVEVVERSGRTQRCRLRFPGGELEFNLGVPGDHNAQNAAAAIAVGLMLRADSVDLADALIDFRGVDRRLQLLVETAGVTIIDDYAHHPTEVAASLDSVRRSEPEARLTVVFQPHLYSRTRAFAAEFAAALSTADEALVLPIFPAREAPLPGVSSDLIVSAGFPRVRAASPAEAIEAVEEAAGGTRSVFVFMGAGDVTALARRAANEVMSDAVGG
jgi:UDP-N-acetylmuramate--alanine ligase